MTRYGAHVTAEQSTPGVVLVSVWGALGTILHQEYVPTSADTAAMRQHNTSGIAKDWGVPIEQVRTVIQKACAACTPRETAPTQGGATTRPLPAPVQPDTRRADTRPPRPAVAPVVGAGATEELF